MANSRIPVSEVPKELLHQRNPNRGLNLRFLAQGKDVIPIPGNKERTYLEEKGQALYVELTADDLSRLYYASPTGVASGPPAMKLECSRSAC